MGPHTKEKSLRDRLHDRKNTVKLTLQSVEVG